LAWAKKEKPLRKKPAGERETKPKAVKRATGWAHGVEKRNRHKGRGVNNPNDLHGWKKRAPLNRETRQRVKVERICGRGGKSSIDRLQKGDILR